MCTSGGVTSFLRAASDIHVMMACITLCLLSGHTHNLSMAAKKGVSEGLGTRLSNQHLSIENVQELKTLTRYILVIKLPK